MYQAKSGVKNFFPLLGGSPLPPLDKNFFSQSEHVSSQIWCQKFFPLLGGGVPRQKNFSRSEHVSSQIWCQKCFPLLGGGGSLVKKFFPGLNMYQAKSGVKNFSLYWDQPPPKSETGDPPQKNLRLEPPPENLRLGTPPENLRPGTLPQNIWDWGPPLENLRLGTPPTWTWDTPRRGVDWHTKWKYNLPHPSDAGGNKLNLFVDQKVLDRKATAVLTTHSVIKLHLAEVQDTTLPLPKDISKFRCTVSYDSEQFSKYWLHANNFDQPPFWWRYWKARLKQTTGYQDHTSVCVIVHSKE